MGSLCNILEFVEGLEVFKEELQKHGVSFENLRQLEAEQSQDQSKFEGDPFPIPRFHISPHSSLPDVQTAEDLSDQVSLLLSKASAYAVAAAFFPMSLFTSFNTIVVCAQVQDDLEKTKEVEKVEKLEKRRTSLMTP